MKYKKIKNRLFKKQTREWQEIKTILFCIRFIKWVPKKKGTELLKRMRVNQTNTNLVAIPKPVKVQISV